VLTVIATLAARLLVSMYGQTRSTGPEAISWRLILAYLSSADLSYKGMSSLAGAVLNAVASSRRRCGNNVIKHT